MYQSTSRLLEKFAQKRPRDEIKHTDWNYVVSVLSKQIDKVQLTASSTIIPVSREEPEDKTKGTIWFKIL